MVEYDLPLNEVVFDFYDRLKSIYQGLCQLRLPARRLPRGRSGQALHPRQCRAGRCALHAGAPLGCGIARPHHVRKAQGADPAASVHDPDPGGDRRAGHRPRDHFARSARTSRPNATAATPPASASCSKPRKRARSACASSARSKSRRKPSSRPSRWAIPRAGASPYSLHEDGRTPRQCLSDYRCLGKREDLAGRFPRPAGGPMSSAGRF